MNRALELKVLKRSVQSFAGGMSTFLLLFLLAYTVTDVLKVRFLAGTFFQLATWPQPMLGLVMARDIDGKVSFDTVVLAMLLQILIYSLLTYVALEWYASRKRLP